MSLINALAESPQSLKCLGEKKYPAPEPKGFCDSGTGGVCPVSSGYVLKLVQSMGCSPSGSAVGLLSPGTCRPHHRAPTWKRGGSDICAGRANNSMNVIIIESDTGRAVTAQKPRSLAKANGILD